MHRRRLPLVLCCVLAQFVGCGGASDKPPVVPVSGSVTFDGEPLVGAVVSFIDAAGKLNPGSGTTDENGEYKIGFTTNDGLVPGSYVVTFTHYVASDGSPLKLAEGIDGEQLAMQGAAKSSLPENVNSANLKVEVKKGAKNVFDWNIKPDGTVEIEQ